jgi:hypothetical protein
MVEAMPIVDRPITTSMHRNEVICYWDAKLFAFGDWERYAMDGIERRHRDAVGRLLERGVRHRQRPPGCSQTVR